MRIDDDTAAEIGIALNEATLLGAEYVSDINMLFTTFAVLTLPDDHSSEPTDPRRQIIFTDIGRIAAALRNVRWNDYSASAITFEVSDLLSIVQSFGGQPIYGWDFINNDDQAFDNWKDRLSLDFMPTNGCRDNRIMLFQEDATVDRHLDVWVWFGDLIIRDASGSRIPLSDFIAGGKRWWDAFNANDPRTQGHGMFPGTSSSQPPGWPGR